MKAALKDKIFGYVICLFFLIFFSMTATEAKKTKVIYYKLVEVDKLDPTIQMDIRYATKNNFLGYEVYTKAKAFLQEPVAEALARVSKSVKKEGYGLLIFDAYRPYSVTKIFWEKISPNLRKYVADPNIGSNHNRGCAVDLTLYDLMTGKEVKMPTAYDTFSDESSPSYNGAAKEELKMRNFLIESMKKEDFTVHPNEWWHFDHKNCSLYPILDLTFEEI